MYSNAEKKVSDALKRDLITEINSFHIELSGNALSEKELERLYQNDIADLELMLAHKRFNDKFEPAPRTIVKEYF